MNLHRRTRMPRIPAPRACHSRGRLDLLENHPCGIRDLAARTSPLERAVVVGRLGPESATMSKMNKDEHRSPRGRCPPHVANGLPLLHGIWLWMPPSRRVTARGKHPPWPCNLKPHTYAVEASHSWPGRMGARPHATSVCENQGPCGGPILGFHDVLHLWNGRAQEQTRLCDVETWSKECLKDLRAQWKFASYVASLLEDRWVVYALHWVPAATARRVGRPPSAWHSSIEGFCRWRRSVSGLKRRGIDNKDASPG